MVTVFSGVGVGSVSSGATEMMEGLGFLSCVRGLGPSAVGFAALDAAKPTAEGPNPTATVGDGDLLTLLFLLAVVF